MKLTESASSHRHAARTYSENRPVLQDLGTANGTCLNSVRLQQVHHLHVADHIGIENSCTSFTYDSTASPAGRTLNPDA